MGSHLLGSLPKEAAHHYKAALRIHKGTKNVPMICRLLVNLGLADMNMGAYDRSMRSLEKAGGPHTPIGMDESLAGLDD